MAQLDTLKVACVATDGFEYSELSEPKKAFEAAGAKVEIVSPKKGEIVGMAAQEWVTDKPVHVDVVVTDADPADYDALLLPGGVMNPDALRLSPETISFIKHFVDQEKPIAAICHGPWTLIDANGVESREMTSWPSLQTDLENAGAVWADREVVVDDNLVTSRKPDDIPTFNKAAIELFSSLVAA